MPKPRILERIGRHIAAPMALPRLVWKNLVHPFSQKAAETRYDATLGIDTGGYLAPAEFGSVHGGQAYVPTPPIVAKFLVKHIAAKAAGFTFVDIGSGKGR